MGHDWILDVLTDLKTFARANGLPTLATQLEDASYVAQVEIASQAEEGTFGLHGELAAARRRYRAVGAR